MCWWTNEARCHSCSLVISAGKWRTTGIHIHSQFMMLSALCSCMILFMLTASHFEYVLERFLQPENCTVIFWTGLLTPPVILGTPGTLLFLWAFYLTMMQLIASLLSESCCRFDLLYLLIWNLLLCWVLYRFGRHSEGFSENPTLTGAYARAAVLAYQGTIQLS